MQIHPANEVRNRIGIEACSKNSKFASISQVLHSEKMREGVVTRLQLNGHMIAVGAAAYDKVNSPGPTRRRQAGLSVFSMGNDGFASGLGSICDLKIDHDSVVLH